MLDAAPRGLLLLLLCAAAGRVSAYGCDESKPICAPNFYGPLGYSPYFYRDEKPAVCTPTYATARCEQSGLHVSSPLDERDGSCNIAAEKGSCFFTKQNCNETMTCSDLTALAQELREGGLNIVCRHGKTNWGEYAQETTGCLADGSCIAGGPKRQRLLQRVGEDEVVAWAEAMRHLEIPIERIRTSPFHRCHRHGKLVAETVGSTDVNATLDLLYMANWKEFASEEGLDEGATEIDVKTSQVWRLRSLLGQAPAAGTNRLYVSHGFNIKWGTGLAVDEGTCLVFRPDGEEVGGTTCTRPSLTDSPFTFPAAHCGSIVAETAVTAA